MTAIRAAAALLLAAAVTTVRRGPERSRIAYEEPYAGAKAALFARINRDRKAAGVPPVAYDLLAAKVGDEFCADMAATRAVGHWDTAGRGPHLRYALAGGVDYEAENFASHSRYGYAITEDVERLLLEAHQGFMDEKPPANGHRETILDPQFNHVGIGVALLGGEFRMTEEFVRRVAEWVEVPSGPVRGVPRAKVAMKLPAPWRAGVIEIAYEPPPRTLTVAEVARRGSYAYPDAIHTLRPFLPGGMTWESGGHGDFTASPDGKIEITVPFDRGPGSYFVIAYVGQSKTQRRLSPATAALVVSE